jgi:hypothetical protein
MYEWYNTSPEERKKAGLEGRKWLLGEAGMNVTEMCNRFIQAMEMCLEKFQPKKRYKIVKVSEREKIKYNGIAC